MDKREIVRLLNTDEFRMVKGGLGLALAVCGLIRVITGRGGFKRLIAGSVLAGTAAADLCPASVLLGYPLDGGDTRAQLAAEDGADGWETLDTETPETV